MPSPPTSPPRLWPRLRWVSTAISITAMASIVAVAGYQLVKASWIEPAAVALWLLSATLSATLQGLEIRRALDRRAALRSHLPEMGLLVPILLLTLFGETAPLGLVVFLREALVLARAYLGTSSGQRRMAFLLAQPAKLIAFSFLALITFGTLFLTFPRATTDGRGASLVDAAFTATSATCVTGLAVMNTNSDAASNPDLPSFSTFGQLVIFFLIQIGGLGIMTLSAAVVLFLGRGLGLRSQAFLSEVLEEQSRRDIEHSLRIIVRTTAIVELAGAALLFIRFWPALGDAGRAGTYAIFMSVSAFCNAGFSLWSDSLVGFRSDPLVMVTIMALITLGGLGYLVVAALASRESYRGGPTRAWRHWSPHVKIVLLVSLALVAGGAVVYYYLEFHASLSGLSRGDKLMAALFQSVTMRTAGFNTVDLGALSRVGLVSMLLLMFVGGSSGSTAGGVKTTTVAVVFLGVRAMLAGRDDVEVYGRTIPKSIVYKAISILVIFVGLLVVGLLALLWVEPGQSFEALLFETVSALATVGVSTGITSSLGVPAKLIIIFLMFVGRIGPLTLALAASEQVRSVPVRYPEGRFMVG